MQIVELPFLSLFTEDVVDNFSGKPKFLQVADFVLQAIDAGRIKKGQRLPSIYELSSRLNIAKDTAQKAYEKLKNIGVLSSHRGKGFFVVRDNFSKPMKIALFFNMLSEHKRVIYDAFIQWRIR